MAKFQRTLKAEEDLIEIWCYIAEDNPSAADSFLDLIEEKCNLLAESPKIGTLRSDITDNLRYFPVQKYLIFYREINDGIEVVRVVHGSRYLPTLFN